MFNHYHIGGLQVASPGRFPGTTHWSASNVDSPYVGYRFAPKLPALAMLPQKTNNYKRYWLLIPVVGVVMAMTVAGAISLWHLGKLVTYANTRIAV